MAQGDFDVRKNGASVGTMIFGAGATVMGSNAASATARGTGDIMTVIAPASPDAALADVTVSVLGDLSRDLQRSRPVHDAGPLADEVRLQGCPRSGPDLGHGPSFELALAYARTAIE